ncbi:MAG: hypothetical protein ABSD62_14600 [Candidatus Limnocylindrales bacterium]|jgi:hypothetical protein
MSNTETSPKVTLPEGWSIPTYRETSQANSAGQVVQGIAYTLQSPGGQTSSLFIPYSVLHQTAAVEAAFLQRIAALTAIAP